MSIDVAAEAYDLFMGRYAAPLAPRFADLAGVWAGSGQRVLDVGCGPGALTTVLATRVGAGNVVALDPSEPFVSAARARCPGVQVRLGVAEQLPFDDATFDVALAQLVVHSLADPVAGLREMGRVVGPRGRIGACVWDHGGRAGPMSPFWDAVREIEPDAVTEERQPGASEGSLGALCAEAGLEVLDVGRLTVVVAHDSFGEWWQSNSLGLDLAGAHLASLREPGRTRLRAACERLFPAAPFEVEASAWTVLARPLEAR